MTTTEIKQLTDQELAALNERFESASPQEIVRWADGRFGSELVLMSSFGLEDVAVFDMFWRINPKARVMTLDTLRLPTETYTLMDRIRARYESEIEAFVPNLDDVQEMTDREGYNLFYKSIENRKLCCGIRKVEPLNRALNSAGAWITGLRRDQGMARGEIKIVERDEAHDNYKVSPLANWNFDQVREYVDENSVPYNELHDNGYPSIGCLPCTRAIEPGEDLRAGRWWWELDPDAKECGLHIVEKATR